MRILRRPDAQLFYEVSGTGPDVVLLHPFPLNHKFWKPIADQLSARHRVIMPDLRGHGDSELGEGSATMQKMADDLAALCREERITKAFFAGVSVGGYVLFEFWRRYREHVAALVLANTRATAESREGRATRLASADKVLREGTAGFFEEMAAKLVSAATKSNRPDIVENARRMMRKMSPQSVAGVQRGIADRVDSIAILKTINIPCLIVAGAEDTVPMDEAELMKAQIPRSRLHVIARAGHYAALEQPDEFGRLLCGFFEGLPR